MKEKLPGVDVVFMLGVAQDSSHVDGDAEGLSVFVNSRVGTAAFDRYPKLKVIATRSTGYDHIDIAEAHRRGIAVVTVPSYGVNTVAEFAFALLLTLCRHVALGQGRVQHTQSFVSQQGLTGIDLEGKTMGVVGTGRIGVHAIKIANGFGMKVIAYDAFENDALQATHTFTYVTLDELLLQSDVITLHVPYNEDTHHLINKNNISLIKKGAYLINTARGGVVETEALVEALKNGTLAGAGLDVLEGEGDMATTDELPDGRKQIAEANKWLIASPNVIVTPHVAFDTAEAIERILTTTAENIIAFKNGTPQNVVA